MVNKVARCELRSSGLLRSKQWQFLTDVSGQLIDPILRGQESKRWKGPIGCPETSVRTCHCSLHNNPEERSSHVLRGGGLKPRRFDVVCSSHAGDSCWMWRRAAWHMIQAFQNILLSPSSGWISRKLLPLSSRYSLSQTRYRQQVNPKRRYLRPKQHGVLHQVLLKRRYTCTSQTIENLKVGLCPDRQSYEGLQMWVSLPVGTVSGCKCVTACCNSDTSPVIHQDGYGVMSYWWKVHSGRIRVIRRAACGKLAPTEVTKYG